MIENSRDTYFYCELYNENNEILARNTELGTPPKHFKFLNPNISVSVKKENGVAHISLKASAFAKNVEVSFKNHDIALSDNYFDLINDTPYTVFAKTELSAEELLSEIKTMSVYDISE